MFGIIVAVVVALAAAAVYVGHRGRSQATAKVTSVSCQWRHSRMYATATVKNTSDKQGFFDLRVSYELAQHGKQPMMTALAPVDARASKTFSWGDLSGYTGEAITSCTGSVGPEPEGND